MEFAPALRGRRPAGAASPVRRADRAIPIPDQRRAQPSGNRAEHRSLDHDADAGGRERVAAALAVDRSAACTTTRRAKRRSARSCRRTATIKLGEHLWHVTATEHASWTDWLLSESTVRIQAGDTTSSPQGLAPMELRPEHDRRQLLQSPGADRRRRCSGSGTLSTSHDGPLGTRHLLEGRRRHAAQQLRRLEREPAGAHRARRTARWSRRLDFGEDTLQHVESTDVALFAQDRIQAGPRWYIEAGGRLDRDGILDHWNVTPRAGTAIVLDRAGNAVLRGGYGRVLRTDAVRRRRVRSVREPRLKHALPRTGRRRSRRRRPFTYVTAPN